MNYHSHIGKHLRLTNYDYRTPGVYFVTFCTKHRRPVLSEIRTGTSIAHPPEVILTPAGSVLDSAICQIPLRYPSVSVKQYVIMPNHVHLLLQLKDDSSPTLGRIIQQLKGTASKQLGESLWQDKYYNDHRMAKSIEDSIDFAAKRQVWQRMILKIIRPMLIAMSIWQNSKAVLLRSKAARRKAFSLFAIT